EKGPLLLKQVGSTPFLPCRTGRALPPQLSSVRLVLTSAAAGRPGPSPAFPGHAGGAGGPRAVCRHRPEGSKRKGHGGVVPRRRAAVSGTVKPCPVVPDTAGPACGRDISTRRAGPP